MLFKSGPNYRHFKKWKKAVKLWRKAKLSAVVVFAKEFVPSIKTCYLKSLASQNNGAVVTAGKKAG